MMTRWLFASGQNPAYSTPSFFLNLNLDLNPYLNLYLKLN